MNEKKDQEESANQKPNDIQKESINKETQYNEDKLSKLNVLP
jgi:hypothetical protein